MDRLEQQLRSVLTEERLEIRPAPGAVQAVHEGVRRRKRRNAALSAAASFVLVGGGIATAVAATQGGHAVVEPGQPNPTASAPPSHTDASPLPGLRQGVVVPWNPISYNPSKPFALAGTTPDSDLPWCGAGQLSVSASEFQGATGSAAGVLTLTNNGNVCGIQGTPALTGYTDGHKAVTEAEVADPFLVHPWVALQHGEQARTFVQIVGDGSRCGLGAVTRLTVDVGNGIAPMSLDLSNGGVTPRCGSAPKDQQVDYYLVSAADWTRADGSPRLPMGDFSATIRDQPATAMQGTTIHYRVLLSTRGASIDPCLPYREQLMSLDGTRTTLAASYFLIDCDAIAHDSGADSYLLDMQLAVPKDAPVGTYALQWQTPIPDLRADQAPSIRVMAAGPNCTGNQISITGDGLNGALGSYYGRVIIANVSNTPCTLRGYPGVQFAGPSGEKLRTFPQHDTSHAYETVTLRPHGGTASFIVSGSDWMPPDGSTPCPESKGLYVIQPGGFLSDQVLVHGVAADCEHEHLRVWPVVAGSHAMAN